MSAATPTRDGFVFSPAPAPPKGPKNGTTSACAASNCPIIVRFKNGSWVHAIRNPARPYDHDPAPAD